MTRLEYKDREKPAPGSTPGSKLDKRTSDAIDEIEGPADRGNPMSKKQPGGQPGQREESPTQSPPNKPGQYEHPPVEEPKDRATKSGRLKLPPAEDPLKQEDPPAPEGDKGHVS